MKFNIITNNSSKSLKFKDALIGKLKGHEYCEKDYQYLFIIGGDGFFLSEFNKVIKQDLRVIFINSGTLGFYSYTNKIEEIEEKDLLNSDKYQKLDYLVANINDDEYYCINDFAFQNNHSTNLELLINGEHVQNFFGNGFLVATNYGSTARNKSLKGPIIFPNVSVMTFLEVESIQNKFNISLNAPLVLNSQSILEIKINNRAKSNGWFLIDGREINNDKKEISIKISMLNSQAKILLCSSISGYIKKLNSTFINEE